jgi:hypothetical protein
MNICRKHATIARTELIIMYKALKRDRNLCQCAAIRSLVDESGNPKKAIQLQAISLLPVWIIFITKRTTQKVKRPNNRLQISLVLKLVRSVVQEHIIYAKF